LDFRRTTGSYRKENTKFPFVFPTRYERLCLTQSSSIDASLGFHRAFVFLPHRKYKPLAIPQAMTSYVTHTEGLHVFSVRWLELELGLLDTPFCIAEIKMIKFPSFLRGTILYFIKYFFLRCTILQVGVGGHFDRLTRGCYKHDLSFNLEVIQCLSVLSKNNHKVM
jgi:hypothetical protein